MNRYPSIEDHGLIGDLQTAALVATDGSIDWFCTPRFDSPSIFGSLLDAANGGRLRVAPRGEPCTAKQMYFPDTAILISRFLTEGGVGEVVDFMPPTAAGASTDRHRLVRMVQCVRGEVEFDVEIAPRFDYGRQKHSVHHTENGAVLVAEDGTTLTLHAVREAGAERLAQAYVTDHGDVRFTLPLRAGQLRGVILETGAEGPPQEIRPAELTRLFDETVRFWRTWVARSSYSGRWREIVHRSAITLKLLTYAPTGALVAAATAGLPEQVGGERNWDYRYTWVRDASFSVYALLGLGLTDEAAAFATWLRDRVEEHRGDGPPLKIMYRIDGSSDLVEETLSHWEGYRGSSPVRIGNGAVDQLQLDIYGEALDSIALADQHGLEIGHRGWQAATQMLDWLVDNWDRPDEGIWETRGGRQDFTYGRLMSWVAFDRGIAISTRRRRPAPLERWVRQRDAIYTQVLERGWDPNRRAFVQQYGSPVLDSSLLRMSALGFVAPRDELWLSTLDAMESELVSDSLVFRYDPAASPDGLRGSEGTFSLCTFNYVDALARAGRVDRARLVFEKMLTYANHLGLFAEEIGPRGEQLGNFPQAFTHLALIDAALTLDRAVDIDGGRSSSASDILLLT